MIIVNGWKPLTIVTKSSILDVAAVLDPPLALYYKISIICLFSHFVFSLCPFYTVLLQYCYLHYLFLAIACFEQFQF